MADEPAALAWWVGGYNQEGCEMTALQIRLFVARSIRAVHAQEEFARQLRPGADVPAQRPRERTASPRLTLVVPR